MNINEITIDFSHMAVITDDNAAREFLAAEGMLGQLEPEPPFTSASLTWRSANTNAMIHAQNFRGCEDDGYVIVILPCEHYTLEQAALIFALEMAHTNARPGTEKTFDLNPAAN